MRRRTFVKFALGVLGTVFSRPLFALGGDDKFVVAHLDYSGNANPRSSAIRRLLLEFEKRTSVLCAPRVPSVKLTDKALFEHPFLMMLGDRKFESFSDTETEKLRNYLLAGGFLVVDSSEGVVDGVFLRQIKRELGRVFPERKVVPIPSDHVIYKSFFLVKESVGRLAIEPKLLGVFDEDRLLVVISQNDMAGAWARDNFGSWVYDCSPGGDRQREMAYRLGMNMLMYALCINYKADQVHVPFILKRRKWKIE